MAYVMVSDLQVVLFFVCFIIKNFENIFIRHLVVGYIIIYRTTIIPNTLDKEANYMEFRIVEDWLT